MNPVIKPISVVLKEARQTKGVSLDEAYKATKIHAKILHALEEGTTLGLSHVYVKSYIKIYAKFLGLSQHELDKYLHTAPPKEKKVNLDAAFISEGEKIQDYSRQYILSNLASLISRHKKSIIIFVIFFLILITIPRCFHKKEIVPLKKTTAIESNYIAQAEIPKVKPKAREQENAPLAKVGEVLRLTILAELDTWMQIKVDGKVVFTGILKSSSSETWQAKDKFNLWLANAGTVRMELNGKILSPIGRRGQLLKDVQITREGLSIKK